MLRVLKSKQIKCPYSLISSCPLFLCLQLQTFLGDLAEAVLIQGTRGSQSISIGAAGNWNSSQATRYFMLSNRLNIEMTDPEIRGGIDGFALGSTLTSTLGTFSNLRLSQLLDMYYAPRVSKIL